MILIEDILKLHKKSINDFGGSPGIRDFGLLASAIARPFQTFGGEELYQNIFEKAAALGESLIINHPFVDGNKRTGMLAMVSLLINHNCKFTATPENFYNFVINISTGTIPFEKMVEWLKENINLSQLIDAVKQLKVIFLMACFWQNILQVLP